MDIFFWVVAVLLVGMGGFTGYLNWKTFFESKKAKTAFKKSHPDAQVFHCGTLRLWLYILMLAACVGFSVMMFVMPLSAEQSDSRYAQAVVYIGLAIFAIAMIGEGLADYEIYYTSDGFLYEADVIRFKSIRAVDVQKGLFKSSSISLTSGKDFTVSKQMASWVSERLDEWRASRKGEFKTRKERRAAARARRESR